MVVAALDLMRSVRAPDEADAPLVVNPDAVLSCSVASKALQPVPRRASEVFQHAGCIQKEKLAVRLPLHLGSQSRHPLSFKDPPRQGVPEAADHGARLWHFDSNVKRYYQGAG